MSFNSLYTCCNNIAISTVPVYCIGGLEEDKHPILTFPEVGLKHLDSPNSFKELNTTLLYLKSLMRLDPPHPPNHPFNSPSSDLSASVSLIFTFWSLEPGHYICRTDFDWLTYQRVNLMHVHGSIDCHHTLMLNSRIANLVRTCNSQWKSSRIVYVWRYV